MTTRLAFFLFVLLAGLVVLDLYAGTGHTLAVLRRFVPFVESLAFWR